MSAVTIRIQHFRVLDNLVWSPQDVCLLAGANGTGKTTTIEALRFLRTVFRQGHEAAFNALDGRYFRRQEVSEEQPVEFDIEVAGVRWKLRFPMSSHGLRGVFGEELFHNGELVLRAAMFDDGWYLGKQRQQLDDTRCCSRVLWDRGNAEWMKPLVDLWNGVRIHSTYRLDLVKRSQPADASQSYLHWSGKNLWSVLATWKASPLRYKNQFEWVLSATREAFPGQIHLIEFDRHLPFLYKPGATDPADGLPPERMADGLLTGLLHLTAIAGAQPDSILAFDEVENQLHPHAIRSILAAMRKRADEHNLTIILTTHSPVVMNEFKGDEDQFYVLERQGDGPVPQALSQLHDPDWLAHYELGELYEREEFGSPRPGMS